MRWSLFIIALLLLTQPGRAQVTVTVPGSNQGGAVRPSNANYGPPQVVDLDALNLIPVVPPMPAPSPDLPRVSLTVLAMRDRTSPWKGSPRS